MTKRSSSSYTSCDNLSSTASTSVICVIATILKLAIIYSIGITVSYPYTKQNGVFPVNFLPVVRYAHNTVEIFLSQSSLWALQIFVNVFPRIFKSSNISICLRVIRCCPCMLNLEFFREFCNQLVNKVCTLITY